MCRKWSRHLEKRPEDELTFTQWDKWCRSEEDRAEYYEALSEFIEIYAYLMEEIEKTPFWRFCKLARLHRFVKNSITWL